MSDASTTDGATPADSSEAGYGEVPARSDVAAEPARDDDEATTATGYGEVPGERAAGPSVETADGVPEGYGEVPNPSEDDAPTAGSGTEDWQPEQYDADRG